MLTYFNTQTLHCSWKIFSIFWLNKCMRVYFIISTFHRFRCPNSISRRWGLWSTWDDLLASYVTTTDGSNLFFLFLKGPKFEKIGKGYFFVVILSQYLKIKGPLNILKGIGSIIRCYIESQEIIPCWHRTSEKTRRVKPR